MVWCCQDAVPVWPCLVATALLIFLTVCVCTGVRSQTKNARWLLYRHDTAASGLHLQQRCHSADPPGAEGQGQQDGGGQMHAAGTHGRLWAGPLRTGRGGHEGACSPMSLCFGLSAAVPVLLLHAVQALPQSQPACHLNANQSINQSVNKSRSTHGSPPRVQPSLK